MLVQLTSATLRGLASCSRPACGRGLLTLMGSSSWQKCPKSKNPSTSASPWLRFHRSNLATPRGARQCAGLNRGFGANEAVSAAHAYTGCRTAGLPPTFCDVCVASDNALSCAWSLQKREPVVCLIIVPGQAAAWPCFAPKVTARHLASRKVGAAQSLRHCSHPQPKYRRMFVAKNKSRDDGSSRANRPRSWRKKKRTSCRAASRSTAGTMHAQLQVTSWACHARRLLPCRLGAEKASRSPADPHLPEVLCAVCSLQVCCRTRSIRA